MKSVLYSEWLKLKRSKAPLACSLGTCIVPLFVLFNSIQRYLKKSVGNNRLVRPV